MTPREHIIQKQIAWARLRGFELVGSAKERGLPTYVRNESENLFQPLSAETRANMLDGDGGELTETEARMPKFHAVHSSSALGINVFDYWRDKTDISPVTAACGLTQKGTARSGAISFEAKLPVFSDGKPPNIDVLIRTAIGSIEYLAIECKFTEAYGSRSADEDAHGLKGKYLDDADWTDLTNLRGLANRISPRDGEHRFLHAAQLNKHILGLLAKTGDRKKFRLLYLWYDALGKAGATHRKEADRFLEIARADGILFYHMTYQELIWALQKHRDQHGAYVDYLTERYL